MAETVARVSWGKCLVCGAAGTAGELKRCSGCRNDGIEYCGKACQAVDWKVHSKVCVQPRGLDGLTPFELVDGARAHEAVAKTNEGGRPAMAAGKEASSPAAKAHRTVLVLLHGLGDEASNFVEFGRKMELPGTRVVAVCAPLPLPYGMPGKCWFLAFEPDGELIPGKTGEKRRLRELARARTRMHHTINALRTPHEDGVVPTILLFGYGHGAIVAIDAALSYPESGAISGVVAVSGGCLLPEIRTDPAAAGPADGLLRRVGWHPASATTTPVLVHHGISDPSLPVRDAEAACSALKSAGVQVEWAEFARGAEPPKDEREMRRIFEFLAPKLQLPSRLDEMAKEPDTTLIDVTGIVPNPTDSAGMHTV